MRLFLAIFLAFVAASSAEQNANDLRPLEDLHDPKLTKEYPSNEEDQLLGSPSFDEVKRELESHGMLKKPAVIGLYRRGEEPTDDEIRNPEKDQPSKRRIHPAHFNRPVCKRTWLVPHRIQIGRSATLLLHRFSCRRVRCAQCGKRYGLCEKTYTWITIRLCYRSSNLKWLWYWQSFRVDGCCQCHMHHRK